MSESLPNVREAPERAPDPKSDAAQNAVDVIAGQFIEQGVPVSDADQPQQTTVGDALAARTQEAEQPEAPSADEERYAWLDEEPEEEIDLDAPEEEPDEQPAAEAEGQEWEDEDTKRLKAQVRKAEKKAAHEQELRVRSERKNWRSEAAKAFPYSEHKLDQVTATSRRDFLRQARELHREALSTLERYGPGIQNAENERQEEAKQWGPAAAGPSGAEVSRAGADEEIAASRAAVSAGTRSLEQHISLMAKHGR